MGGIMIKAITQYLDEAEKICPEKIAFSDAEKYCTYASLKRESLKMANLLWDYSNCPIGIYLDKSIDSIICMMGIAYSGNFYCVIDTKLHLERVNAMIEHLDPAVIITDKNHFEYLNTIINRKIKIILIEDAYSDRNALALNRVKPLNPDNNLYVMFTSGSTGEPRAVVTSHFAVSEYAEAATNAYGIEENTIFGNQFPLYFVGSVEDIYLTIKNRATMHIIPDKFFYTPYKVAEYINEKQINTVIWVPSAMKLLAETKAWDFADMSCLKKVIFGGEPLSVQTYEQWKNHIPGAVFINGYGSTEVTAGGCFFVVKEEKIKGGCIPIGIGFPNVCTYVVNNEKQIIDEGIGELYIESSSLAKGYYKNPQLTNTKFVKSEGEISFSERTYKTGDLVELVDGILYYIGRIDNQIKKNGYRIELGEIESLAGDITDVYDTACLWNGNKIYLFYTGSVNEKELFSKLREKLPKYMIPDEVRLIAAFPYNQNGKKDKKRLMDAILGECDEK